jgi:hypothetical protein
MPILTPEATAGADWPEPKNRNWQQIMHQATLEKWADLLGPLFPRGAEFALSPQLNQISVCWRPVSIERAGARSVAISIAPNAMKDYRNAQDGQRARADRKLFAHVHSNLKRLRGDDCGAGEGEFRIVVASVDILSR